ncbi:hypothetical protein KC887_00250 [Candidatus Kaiserbacteria bacterium]|nr:hypothetical protein [Candidatus Kaiserbacteria bacterium]
MDLRYAIYQATKRNVSHRNLPTQQTTYFYDNFVPKQRTRNLYFRKKILELCYSSDAFIEDIQCICKRDLLFEINTFGLTLSIIDNPESPTQPMITRPYQDEGILLIQNAIGKKDVCIPKSRNVGGTWMCLIAMEHRWRYMPDQNFLLCSRDAKSVCSPGERKGLLQKIFWYTTNLPVFIQPEGFIGVAEKDLVSAKNMTLVNPDNNSVFKGEAQVPNVGTSDRCQAIFLDEVSRMKFAEQIFTSTRDTSDCRLFNSSPNGRFGVGEPFYKQVQNPYVEKIWVHWSDIAERRKGLYYIDENENKQKFEKGWKWQDDYDFTQLTFSKRKPRSEWYDRQCEREGLKKRRIAQELDLNFLKSGASYVDDSVVSEWIKEKCLPPTSYGNLIVDPETCEGTWVEGDMSESKAFLWIDLDPTTKLPPYDRYVVGVDIAHGTGGKFSSYSSLVVGRHSNRKIVARFASNTIKPSQFARLCVGYCKMFHNALLVPEVNGPTGSSFLEVLRDENIYGNFYYRRVAGIDTDIETEKIGYWNSDRGTSLLDALIDGMSRDKIFVCDEMVYKELAQYEFAADGKIIHSGSRSIDVTGNEGLAHGDVAIATGCVYAGFKSLGEYQETKSDTDELRRMPYPCIANRMLERPATKSPYSWY